MKKLILPILLSLTFSNGFAACIKPSQKEVTLLAALSYAQLYDKMSSLTDTYCFQYRSNDGAANAPLMFNTSAKGLDLLQSKSGRSYVSMAIDQNNMDLFSYTLIDGAMVSDRVKQKTLSDIKEVISKNFPTIDTSRVNKDLSTQSKKELLDLMAKEYSQSLVINEDKMKNTALTYVIATNNPQYLTDALGMLKEKKLFMKKNAMGVTSMHLAFSPLLKGKNTEELSKKLINIIPVNYMINNVIWNYDYFQFAEAFKDNNPMFYNMLKEKYRVQITQQIDSKSKLEIEKALKLYWEIDDDDN